ncbi:membrane dipeptidase [Flavihumibacter sp. UBA7668]|uniref:membrane dipeptidase n=1 Tax=Flavihumibacter sp. UBA7668 TaxID=1946542 RepID=UPI0025C68D2E|nr:membrane dipeptidase [Flavihumibacter sp. UBA7668]
MFKFADIHCHPNLKTFGHSFNESVISDPRSNLWYHQPLTKYRRLVKNISGISSYSQADLSAMCSGNVKLAFVSLYPFEKGFFINLTGSGLVSAYVSDLVTGIGYRRVRHLQRHLDYFQDLEREYDFFRNSERSSPENGEDRSWTFISSSQELEEVMIAKNRLGIVLSIEGAHVFNTGLGEFGRTPDPDEVVEKVRAVKQWEHPPVFITFAHNFYNDLCGHAPSLEILGPLVNQKNGMNEGFTELGIKTLHELLSDEQGAPILIDIKHMSLKARKQYFEILETDYAPSQWLPIIVSHGGVTGLNLIGGTTIPGAENLFYKTDINFYDEELITISKSGGLFALQLDCRRLASKSFIHQVPAIAAQKKVSPAALLVWTQIQHIAEVLDRARLPAWDMICIGSDFDGSVNPPDGCLGSMDFSDLGMNLLKLIENYLLLRKGTWNLPENGWLEPVSIMQKISSGNAVSFLDQYFRKYKKKPAL